MILFINACVRNESRTRQLAEAVLRKVLKDAERGISAPGTETSEGAKRPFEIQEVKLEDIAFPVVDEAFLKRRDALIAQQKWDDPIFDLARQFASADEIVVAAPYWDLSFPAALKQYFEQINCMGVTFEYTPDGYPEPMCRTKKLHYVTTAGGAFVPEEFGYGYVKALAQGFYGIQDVELTMAVGFDIAGADVEKILKDAIDQVEGGK
ncbi:MAG: NAD(P)H-dependent oxidoreductase [Clostridiales bacterium]|nr:NAD(P)H-dependent oxidoreductase [Clostridiales bacterium]